jgi:septal ring-binding cell division protein DamX
MAGELRKELSALKDHLPLSFGGRGDGHAWSREVTAVLVQAAAGSSPAAGSSRASSRASPSIPSPTVRTRDAALSPFRADEIDETDETWDADPLRNASSADALHADALHADALKADAAHADALAELRGAITGHYELQVIASDCL